MRPADHPPGGWDGRAKAGFSLVRNDDGGRGGGRPALAQTAAQPAATRPGEARGGTAQPGDEAIQYTGGTEVKRLRIINTAELEVEAEKILPKGGYGYIFGGSGAEYTKRENLRAMEAIPIEPHFLSGVLKPDLTNDDPRPQTAVPDHRAADGKPRPRARVEGDRHRDRGVAPSAR